MSENVFANSCISEYFNNLNFFPTKTYIFLADKGFVPPPPLSDMSAKNVICFCTSLLSILRAELRLTKSKHIKSKNTVFRRLFLKIVKLQIYFYFKDIYLHWDLKILLFEFSILLSAKFQKDRFL